MFVPTQLVILLATITHFRLRSVVSMLVSYQILNCVKPVWLKPFCTSRCSSWKHYGTLLKCMSYHMKTYLSKVMKPQAHSHKHVIKQCAVVTHSPHSLKFTWKTLEIYGISSPFPVHAFQEKESIVTEVWDSA